LAKPARFLKRHYSIALGIGVSIMVAYDRHVVPAFV